MENSSQAGDAGIQWKWAVFITAGLVLAGWLSNTPGGLLGKADAIGYAVCHRIDTHSFFLGDRQFPLCARCSGMYLGALLGLAFQSLRGRRGGLPSLRAFTFLGVLAVAFALDGVNSYLHFFPQAPSLYQSENWLRLVTGTGLGLGMAFVLMPVFHQTVWRTWDARPSLSAWRELGGVLLLAIALDLLVLSGDPLVLYPLALLSAAGVLVLLTMVYTLVWVMLFHQENRRTQWVELLVPVVAGFTVALVQIGGLDFGRYLLTGTWSGFQL